MKCAHIAIAAFALLPIVAAADDEAKPRSVSCSGETVTTVNRRETDRKPFTESFDWAGGVVKVRGYNEPGFSPSYKAWDNEPFEGRKSFQTEIPNRTENLFFYIDSGRFQVFYSEMSGMRMLERTTNGTCQPYQPSDVFK